MASECNGEESGAKTSPAIVLIVTFVIMMVPGISLAQGKVVVAQASPPQTLPVPAGKENGPAESKPGGARPTTPAPEPARPDADDAGHANPQPALPPAPAEKVAPPIKEN